jgi:hypothetical protein
VLFEVSSASKQLPTKAPHKVKKTWVRGVKRTLVQGVGVGVVLGKTKTQQMKVRHLITSLAMLMGPICMAQSELEFKTYVLTSDLVLEETNAAGVSLNPVVQKYCHSGWRFSVIRQKDADTFIITFFDWYSRAELKANMTAEGSMSKGEDPKAEERKELAAAYNYDMSKPTGMQERFFIISKYQLEKAATALTSRFSPVFGAMVLPFKYRPQTGLVTKDLGLGAVGGLSIRSQRKTSLSVMFGVNVSSITVDSASTEGRVSEPAERSALSLPVGMLFQWESLQVALLTGWDLMFDGNTDQWCYQGKQWFTVGVGVALFSNGGNAKDTVQK